MATGPGGYLSSISPWGSRSTTPKPVQDASNGPGMLKPQLGDSAASTTDHTTSGTSQYRLRAKDYPADCPRASIRWYYAVDAPKRKPAALNPPRQVIKPFPKPKKYITFSPRDSRSIESAFQKLLERDSKSPLSTVQPESDIGVDGSNRNNATTNPNLDEKNATSGMKVPVNEDYLFDVDVERRELAPAYWLGPIYDVRRGSWYYQEGSSIRPCEENLALQLEEGYLKLKPWKYQANSLSVKASQASKSSRPTSMIRENPKRDAALTVSSKEQTETLQPPDSDATDGKSMESNANQIEDRSQRLFGAYMNSVVTYEDMKTAWILTDDLFSRVSSTVYQRFGYLGGTKVVRGFSDDKVKAKPENDEKPQVGKNDLSGKASTGGDKMTDGEQEIEDVKSDKTTDDVPRLLKLERQVSSLVSPDEDGAQDERERKRDEEEIQDYKDTDGDDQDREIEHLILVTHGIGQRLGLRLESINFIHDVNMLRKTIKSVYRSSDDLQALNGQLDKIPKNCRVQVLPVAWRHLLDFPKQNANQRPNNEQDLTEADDIGEDDEYPSLENITVDGVPAIRNLISDLALDILLYQSAYREHIATIVQQESNRVYQLFVQRNPKFNGRVNMIGHSLGSAIAFDILCRQRDDPNSVNNTHQSRSQPGRKHRSSSAVHPSETLPELRLDFDVDDFFCLGSPLGLYQMLKGRRIAARHTQGIEKMQSPLTSDALQTSRSSALMDRNTDTDILEITTSSPKCQQLYNIFHPADPIAYRIEPLISAAMSSLKPQALPYTKKGIFNGPALSGLGAKVGQSVSGLWTSWTSGVASNMLNRSLGIINEGQPATGQSPAASPQAARHPLSAGAGTNTSAGVVKPIDGGTDNADHPPTLLETELETLYSGFQKREDSKSDDAELGEKQGADVKARRLKREEAKVRALNSNGRVDYKVQEGLLDISLLQSIASHLSYWSDEDVCHFILSQLLSRQRTLKH